jgi:folate-dependent phosphoribosylglycinamide formyltransferase PurN
MAYYKNENEDDNYRRRDIDPVLAQEKLAEMDEESVESLREEVERMEHADFFRDIIGVGKRK